MSNQLPSVTSPPWNTTTKRLVTLVVITLIYLVIRHVDRAAWTSVVVAVVLAYLLTPVVSFFERRLTWIKKYERRRTLSVLLAWLLVLGVLGLFVGLIVPATLSQLRAFADNLPSLVQSTQEDIKAALNKPITIGHFRVVPLHVLETAFSQDNNGGQGGGLTTSVQDRLLSMADPAIGFLGGAFSFLITTFFVLVMLFYLMRDGPVFVDYFVGAVPESYQGDARRMLYELGLVWNAYLRGQILLCLTMAMAVYLASLALGLPQPLVLGVLAGFLEFVPNLGAAVSYVPALLFAMTSSSTTIPGLHAGLPFAIVVLVTFMGVHQLEALFLVPRILGRSLDLHPFVVLISILIGASLAGVLGVVLAAPTVATLRLFGRYLRGKLLDEEVFPSMSAYVAQERSVFYRVMRYFWNRRYPEVPADGYEPRQAVGPDLVGETVEPSDLSGWAR
jgi:predicted PurR-regulated permease PerM